MITEEEPGEEAEGYEAFVGHVEQLHGVHNLILGNLSHTHKGVHHYKSAVNDGSSRPIILLDWDSNTWTSHLSAKQQQTKLLLENIVLIYFYTTLMLFCVLNLKQMEIVSWKSQFLDWLLFKVSTQNANIFCHWKPIHQDAAITGGLKHGDPSQLLVMMSSVTYHILQVPMGHCVSKRWREELGKMKWNEPGR